MEKTVACKWCEEETFSIGTRECDRCWELRHRIERDPTLAKRILSGVIKDKT